MPDSPDPSRYEPAEVEPGVFDRWESAGVFTATPEGTAAENFSIAIPPPNVTGALHMGHALNGSIQDALVRLNRMRGKNVRWTVGTDHAGIATQTKVEQALVAEGTTREAVGREAFVERTQEWRQQYGGTIINQFRRLGLSADFEHERFTMDEGYVQAVQKVFVTLFEQGLIYRDTYLVNWDPGSRSAISDLEVEDKECTDTLFEVAYPLKDPVGDVTEVVVATVRPETMLGDVAVAVNPQDERFAHLIGQTVLLPLVGRELPIIGDDYVKTDFGTGCLKITPAHDPNDFEIGNRHGLEQLNVIGEDGRITGGYAPDFEGMKTAEAREAIVAALEASGALRAQEPYVHTVPFSQRSGERIEPLISLQWFMKMESWRSRRSTSSSRAASGSTRRASSAATSSGWPRSVPGSSAASSGGATRSPSGTGNPPTAARARPTAGSSRRPETAGSAIPTCSTPGSARRCGRSPPSAGPSRPPSCGRSTRPRCSRPPATSSSSGSPGW